MSLHGVLSENLTRLCRGEKSIAAVCRATRINRQQFNRYLSGSALPNRRNLEKICRYFKTDESSLFRKFPGTENSGAADPESRSDADMRAILKRLHAESAASVGPGLYFVHFAYPQDPGCIMRSTLLIRRDGNLTTFRRLTGLGERRSSWWSHFTGDHKGIVLERRHWLYFVGLNDVATHEPTLFVMRWIPNAEPMMGGHATILTPAGPTVTAVVISACGEGMSLRTAIRMSHVYSVDDPGIDPMVADAIDQQCRALVTMVKPFDLSVTVQPTAAAP